MKGEDRGEITPHCAEKTLSEFTNTLGEKKEDDHVIGSHEHTPDP